MNPGLVTNCWQTLIEQGATIADLVKQARDRGYPVIELRQGCLGTAETTSLLARPDRLAQLARDCPEVDFDYAMSFPFLSLDADYQQEALVLGQEAALATAGRFVPHLRIVDVTTTGTLQEIAPNVDSLIDLAGTCRQKGIRLSLEHARQPWRLFYDTVCQVREALDESLHPAICFDPANFSLADEQELSAGLLGSLELSEISMVHIKQFRDGRFLERLEAGAVDWRQHRALLQERGYEGPLHLEITASEEIWQCLEESLQYWDACSS
jgi:sugar phosphate isomerase/epimerase